MNASNVNQYIQENVNSTSLTSVYLNHKGKNELVNKYFRELKLVYSIPVVLSFLRVIPFNSGKGSAILSLLFGGSLVTSVLIHNYLNNKLYHDIQFYDFIYPLPPQAIIENEINNRDIYNLKH